MVYDDRVRHPRGDARPRWGSSSSSARAGTRASCRCCARATGCGCPPGRSACWPSTPWPSRCCRRLMLLYVPLSLWMMLFAKLPVLVAHAEQPAPVHAPGAVRHLPGRPVRVHLGAPAARLPARSRSGCCFAYLPYQWLLGLRRACGRSGARRGASNTGRRRPTSAPTAPAPAAAAAPEAAAWLVAGAAAGCGVAPAGPAACPARGSGGAPSAGRSRRSSARPAASPGSWPTASTCSTTPVPGASDDEGIYVVAGLGGAP